MDRNAADSFRVPDSKDPGRRGSNSYKWDLRPKNKAGSDLLPMWVADMDIPIADFILESIRERIAHPYLGYSFAGDEYREAFISWQSRRHGWEIDPDSLVFAPGVMPAIRAAVLELTDPGDEVIIQPPVYYPFFGTVRDNGRTLVENRLRESDGQYGMDLEALEASISPRTRMLILCSPHNPVGRVWTREELTALGEIVLRHDLVVVSDEIHADIRRPDAPFTPFLTLSPELAERTIACHAPSKTFNIPGIASAHLVIPAKALRERMEHALERLGLTLPNVLSLEASKRAYLYGDSWVNGLIEFLDRQIQTFERELEDRFAGRLRAPRIEGTYLAWIDFRPLMEALGIDDRTVRHALTEVGGLWLNTGSSFGENGTGFHRMNLACPPALLQEGISRLAKAVEWLEDGGTL
jgi:cystathionine beta-lyase